MFDMLEAHILLNNGYNMINGVIIHENKIDMNIHNVEKTFEKESELLKELKYNIKRTESFYKINFNIEQILKEYKYSTKKVRVFGEYFSNSRR